MLKLAVESGTRRFILGSSGHVYGVSPRYLPSDERHPLATFDTYTTSKLLGEHLCQLFYENYGLSYAAIRLFNCYGPGQQLGYFIPDKILQAQAGNFGLRGALVTKDWIYIDDVVRAYTSALDSAFVGAVNIGTGIETDLETIARTIARAFGVHVVLQATASPPTRMLCDWGRAQRVLGWQPEISLEEGLERTIDYWKSHD
jgi:nucleoside-diphosphate-sugar epimerase